MLMIGKIYSQLNTNETATMRLIEEPYDKKQNNTTQHKTKQYKTVLMKTVEEKRTHNRVAQYDIIQRIYSSLSRLTMVASDSLMYTNMYADPKLKDCPGCLPKQ